MQYNMHTSISRCPGSRGSVRLELSASSTTPPSRHHHSGVVARGDVDVRRLGAPRHLDARHVVDDAASEFAASQRSAGDLGALVGDALFPSRDVVSLDVALAFSPSFALCWSSPTGEKGLACLANRLGLGFGRRHGKTAH